MTKKYEETFGNRVRQIRQRLMMKQKEFARSLGISEPSMSEIENGKYKPGHDFLYNIVKTHNVNLYYLLFGDGEMFLESLTIGGGLSPYFSTNLEIKRFLWYFERSPILQHFILGHYRRYMNDERENIERDARLFVDETEKDSDRLNDDKSNKSETLVEKPGKTQTKRKE